MNQNELITQFVRYQTPLRMAILGFISILLGLPAVLFFLVPQVRAMENVEISKFFVESVQEQVALLKWIGGIMVSAETGAIIFLVRALFTANSVLINEVKESAVARIGDVKARQEAHDVTRQAVAGLSDTVKDLSMAMERLRQRVEGGQKP